MVASYRCRGRECRGDDRFWRRRGGRSRRRTTTRASGTLAGWGRAPDCVGAIPDPGLHFFFFLGGGGGEQNVRTISRGRGNDGVRSRRRRRDDEKTTEKHEK